MTGTGRYTILLWLTLVDQSKPVAEPYIAATAGTAPLVLARVALGAGEGVAFPAVHALISKHVPRDRHSTSVAWVTAASYAGAAFAFGITPSIIARGGWESAFYGFGTAALLWLPFWLPLDLKELVDGEEGAPRGGGDTPLLEVGLRNRL